MCCNSCLNRIHMKTEFNLLNTSDLRCRVKSCGRTGTDVHGERMLNNCKNKNNIVNGLRFNSYPANVENMVSS